MLKKSLLFVLFCCGICLLLGRPAWGQIDASKLLPAHQAFAPQVFASEDGIKVQFAVADGYYLYRSKIHLDTTPAQVLGQARFSPGKPKQDEFFGPQEVYYHVAEITVPYTRSAPDPYVLRIEHQGCADVGICYPPSQASFQINGTGLFQADDAPKGFQFKNPGASPQPDSTAPANSNRFKLSWDTLNANLLAFFVAGIGLSFTACMYPLLPIVSSIVVGGGPSGKRRAFTLSMIYVQGLALTYTLVGVVAGLTGALLTVWLQQAWVVLAAAMVMVLLALSMFGVFTLQLPGSLQSYFQNQSNRLSGGRMASVFGMGMLSALIVGPCVAPPLAFALGYIGQTGDATLGGLALYALALGTGVPLVLVGTFGGHILPKAGVWMNGIKYAFGCILLAVAVYLATPFLPYSLVVAAYSLLLLIPGSLLLRRGPQFSGSLKGFNLLLGAALTLGSLYFAYQSTQNQSTALHRFLTLSPTMPQPAGDNRSFSDVAALKQAMAAALQADPSQPVYLDFYADWCISCKEMASRTLNQASVQAAVNMQRFFKVDVTANRPEHQALLKEYGLFGPPGIFVVRADGSRSEPLLGFAPPEAFIRWAQQHANKP